MESDIGSWFNGDIHGNKTEELPKTDLMWARERNCQEKKRAKPSLSRLLILNYTCSLNTSFIPLVELVHAEISNTTLEVYTRNKKVIVLLNVLAKDILSSF